MNSIDGAEFTIAESHELKSRAADGEDFKVSAAELKDGFVTLTILCVNGDLTGTKHAASVQMKYQGAVIGSNYFTINVSDDFSFVSEDLDPAISVTAAGATQDATTGAWSFTVDGGEFGKGYDFATVFTGLADGDKFEIASAGKQAEGSDAANPAKRDILVSSLNADGKFKFTKRPGTNYGDAGFLVNVKRGEVVVAKSFVKIDDPIAAIEFAPFPGVFEAEWGGREKALALGAQTIDIQKAFVNAATDITIIHGCPEFFDNWSNAIVNNAAGDPILYNDGNKMVLDDYGKLFAPEDLCRGLFWFYRGLSVRLPENMAPYTDENGKEWTGGGEGYGDYVNGNDIWMGQSWEYANDPEGFYPPTAKYLGLKMDEKTGALITPDNYTGWGFRLAISCGYEYLYGCKNVTSPNGADQVGMLFFNRRVSPEGATMPLSDK